MWTQTPQPTPTPNPPNPTTHPNPTHKKRCCIPLPGLCFPAGRVVSRRPALKLERCGDLLFCFFLGCTSNLDLDERLGLARGGGRCQPPVYPREILNLLYRHVVCSLSRHG